MKVTIYGARGSSPNANTDKTHYGGNTTCIEVVTEAGDIIILDAGTGIRDLGTRLIKENQKNSQCTICFTHSHWDHLYGLTSFQPLFHKDWKVSIYGPHFDTNWNEIIRMIFASSYFPLAWDTISKNHSITNFDPLYSFNIGTAYIETCSTCHPGGNVAYKITADGQTLFFSGDHEWALTSEEDAIRLETFMQGADCIIADAHFFDDEYKNHIGWGHSTISDWIEKAKKVSPKHLILTHHHPDHSDEEISNYLFSMYNLCSTLNFNVAFAYDGMVIDGMDLEESDSLTGRYSCAMCNFSWQIYRYSDHGLVLEEILTKVRKICNAEAGSIYLLEDTSNSLAFSYAQNDLLFPGSEANKMMFLNAKVPLDKNSLVGFAGVTKATQNISNVYALPPNLPYKFNDSFDKSSGYKTVSVLAIPLLSASNQLIGVLQIINSLDEDGKPQPFNAKIQEIVEQMASLAADSIDRNKAATQLVLRMLDTSSLRDPTETAGHVMRVGAIAAELYQRWEEKRGIKCVEEIRATKDLLKHAAMLHDMGKVGISDLILKKPARLTPEEFEIMKTHCALGASLFKTKISPLDVMTHNIVLHHHQKWDGTGYTGDPQTPARSAFNIPWEARITAIADVYDALVSPRCYKEPFSKEKAVAIMKHDAGSHFDPEMIEAFLEILDLVDAIIERYKEEKSC